MTAVTRRLDRGHAPRLPVSLVLVMNNPNSEVLRQIARRLVDADKGLLAMDESIKTCDQRFREVGIPETAVYRQKYRELIVTAPGLERYISGAILCDETMRQKVAGGDYMAAVLTSKGIIPGIKVDNGTVAMAGFPDEKVTEGLDGLAVRLESYYQMGARFAKWRAVVKPGAGLPTPACIGFNAQLLARYAATCQEAGLVPVVEPEVLMDGAHSAGDCEAVTREFLLLVFAALAEHRVDLDGLLLKPNMILPGSAGSDQPGVEKTAAATRSVLLDCVPASVPGIVFLSGGQPAEQASERLNAMNRGDQRPLPWKLSFSFSRAILQPALQLWKGEDANAGAAQSLLLRRAACNHAACAGRYHAGLETNTF